MIDPFIPPTSGVWINAGLSFLSLVISLSCALVVLLLQQWARRYLRVAYPRYEPHRRARIRTFYKDGVETLRIPLTIEVIPVLLHISLFLFFAGLSVYLLSINHTIFKVVTAWIGVCIGLYANLAIMPIILFLPQKFLHIDTFICMRLRSRDPRAVHLDDFFSHSVSKTAEQYALKLNPGIDYRSLLWTFQSLDEDSDLEKFFEGLARDSETGRRLNLRQGFIEPKQDILAYSLAGLTKRILSSKLVSDFLKQRRMII